MCRYKDHFANSGITFVNQLQQLTDEVLKEMGVAMVGHRKRLLHASKELVDESRACEAGNERMCMVLT